MKNRKNAGVSNAEIIIITLLSAILVTMIVAVVVGITNKKNDKPDSDSVTINPSSIVNVHESSDTVMVKNMNTILNAEEVCGNRAQTMSDALKQVKDGGYNTDKIVPASSGEILWDQVSNRFLLVNAVKEVVYKDEYATGNVDLENGAYKLWKITRDVAKEDKGYSLYLANDYTGNLAGLAVSVGIDVGDHSNVGKISYTGTTAGREVVFRTNGGTLAVNAKDDTVKHYGKADKVTVQKVSENSYWEYGDVTFFVAGEGHFTFVKSCALKKLHITGNGAQIEIFAEGFDKNLITKDSSVREVDVTVNGVSVSLDEIKIGDAEAEK